MGSRASKKDNTEPVVIAIDDTISEDSQTLSSSSSLGDIKEEYFNESPSNHRQQPSEEQIEQSQKQQPNEQQSLKLEPPMTIYTKSPYYQYESNLSKQLKSYVQYKKK